MTEGGTTVEFGVVVVEWSDYYSKYYILSRYKIGPIENHSQVLMTHYEGYETSCLDEFLHALNFSQHN